MQGPVSQELTHTQHVSRGRHFNQTHVSGAGWLLPSFAHPRPWAHACGSRHLRPRWLEAVPHQSESPAAVADGWEGMGASWSRPSGTALDFCCHLVPWAWFKVIKLIPSPEAQCSFCHLRRWLHFGSWWWEWAWCSREGQGVGTLKVASPADFCHSLPPPPHFWNLMRYQWFHFILTENVSWILKKTLDKCIRASSVSRNLKKEPSPLLLKWGTHYVRGWVFAPISGCPEEAQGFSTCCHQPFHQRGTRAGRGLFSSTTTFMQI